MGEDTSPASRGPLLLPMAPSSAKYDAGTGEVTETPEIDARIGNLVLPQVLHASESDVVEDHDRAWLHHVQDSRNNRWFEDTVFGSIDENKVRLCERLRVLRPRRVVHKVSDDLGNIGIAFKESWN